MKKKLTVLLVVAVLLVSTVMLAACGGGDGEFLGGLLSKNYFKLSDARKGAEESITSKDGVITFAVVDGYKDTDGVSLASGKVKVDFPKNQDLKINATVVKNALPSGVRFYITVEALDLDTEAKLTLSGSIDSTSIFPKTILISGLSENFQITSYNFNFGTVSGSPADAYIQLENIKITAVNPA